jgi:hypothetical protein
MKSIFPYLRAERRKGAGAGRKGHMELARLWTLRQFHGMNSLILVKRWCRFCLSRRSIRQHLL